MEFLVALILMMLVIASIVGTIHLIGPFPQASTQVRAKASEDAVSRRLHRLDLRSYVIFDNLILPSNGNTPHTEIDHVVVSPYGIFCIETKSHRGLIFGSKNREYWTQCIGNRKFRVYNPLRQNYKHTKALEQLLGAHIKAPIHSYVIFPQAHRITVDTDTVMNDVTQINKKITRHTRQVYDVHEYGRILKTLAYASSRSSELADMHAYEVNAYLNSRVV